MKKLLPLVLLSLSLLPAAHAAPITLNGSWRMVGAECSPDSVVPQDQREKFRRQMEAEAAQNPTTYIFRGTGDFELRMEPQGECVMRFLGSHSLDDGLLRITVRSSERCGRSEALEAPMSLEVRIQLNGAKMTVPYTEDGDAASRSCGPEGVVLQRLELR